DLEKHTEALRQRSAYASPPPPADASAAPSGGPPADTGAPDGDGSPLDAPPAPPPPSRNELLLCEFLVEHEHDADVLELVARHLPLDLLPHPFARTVVSALLTQHRLGGDRLVELCRTTAAEWQPLLGTLLANKQKMLSAREMTKGEAARDLIKIQWITRVKETRGRLPAESTAENDRLRFHLTTLIKTLETQPWEKTARLMTAESGGALTPAVAAPGAAPAPSPAAAAPCAHAADTASAAYGPEEFPPSEYPPDETPD
ncbi:MAG: hypothetical protein LBW77_01730, partial [Verrucomicrobiota bacterium]|nr:hypothetical protein [Verrucomicrobiota bacterium]